MAKSTEPRFELVQSSVVYGLKSSILEPIYLQNFKMYLVAPAARLFNSNEVSLGHLEQWLYVRFPTSRS